MMKKKKGGLVPLFFWFLIKMFFYERFHTQLVSVFFFVGAEVCSLPEDPLMMDIWGFQDTFGIEVRLGEEQVWNLI